MSLGWKSEYSLPVYYIPTLYLLQDENNMLGMKLTDTDINKVKEMLLQKQKDITEQLNELDRSDPILLDIAEASELGSDAWEAEVHMKTVAMKNQLKSLYEEIKQSIERLQRGTYGICKKCGHAISSQRLSAMPTAAICESCIVN